MKKTLTLLMILITLSRLYAQNDDSKKVELQFKERVGFYSVDNRYNLITDTIFHANDGFRVFSGYDIDTLMDGKVYVILKYPNWKGKSQVHNKIIRQEQKILLDTVFLLSIKEILDKGTIKEKIYYQVLDSLKTLAEREVLKRPVHVDIVGRDSLSIAILKDDFENLLLRGKINDVYSLKWPYSTKLASGFISVPFKLRPSQDSVNFNITTDITLGAYIGVKKRISRQGNNFIVIPATLGLSYINVGDNKTSIVNTENSSSLVPGWTWSTGIIFDLNGFNIGFVLGQDFASGVGKDWIYNNKTWYSFSIGYSFLGNNTDKDKKK
jgi:hypothetical protein